MSRRVVLPLLLAVAIVVALVAGGVATGLVPLPSAGSPSPNIYASDRFAREISQRWGSAETGGDYVIGGGAGRVDVDGSVGTMYIPTAGSSKAAVLRDVQALDVDVLVRIAWDKWPVGGRQFAYLEVRVQDGTAYRPKLVLVPNGSVEVHAGAVLDGEEAELGTPVPVPDLEQQPGEYIWFRARVTGTAPAVINVRAWADGTTEPTDWPYTVTDATEALQRPGAVGLRAYLGSRAENAPVTVSFDDLLITPGEPIQSGADASDALSQVRVEYTDTPLGVHPSLSRPGATP